MTLVTTTLLNGIAVAVRILTAIGLNKVLAVSVGPAGYAVVGQFSNVMTVLGSLTGGCIGQGVTKYTAEYRSDPARQFMIWRTAARFMMVGCLLTCAAVFLFHESLAARLLGDKSLGSVFIALAFALPLLAANTLLLAALNGKKEVRRYVLQNIIASILGAAVAAILAWYQGLFGALIALSVNQSIAIVVTLILCRGTGLLNSAVLVGPTDRGAARNLLAFALMTLTSSIIGPLSQLAIREHLAYRFGAVAAGQWQGVTKISEIYLMFFTAALSIYYLPRLAEINEQRSLRLEIVRVYRFLLPLTVGAALLIYIGREPLTTGLFSDEFIGMTDLFAWQLTGDVLKMGSWVLGFVMVGHAMTKWFLFSEVLFASTLLMLTFAATPWLGLEGAPAAFALNYFLYWVFTAWLILWRKRHD